MMTTSQWMDVVSNNLANSGTDGYKADSLTFSDVMVSNMYADRGHGKYIGSLSSGPLTTAETVDRSAGVLRRTGNALDCAFKTADGMFAVQKDGTTFYTRNGAFTVNADRQLVTTQGLPVLDQNGQKIVLTSTDKAQIGSDGVVRQGNETVATLGMYDGDFVKAGNNLWASTRIMPLQKPDLATESLEQSNVDAIGTMVDLIKIQRSFEQSQKSIQTQDEMTGKLFEILNRR